MSKPPPAQLFDTVAFSGCGTLNFYQTGAAAALQELGIDKTLHYSGASAGSGLGVLVASGIDAHLISSKAIELLAPFKGQNILRNPQVLISFADAFLDHFIDGDSLGKIDGRVYISITQISPFRNLLVNEFSDNKDLCRAIRASCHIPSPRLPTVLFRGMRCIDGGVTRNTPLISERCLTVSPFSFGRRCDIQPRKRLNPLRALVVPSPDQADLLFRQGREDALRKLEELSQGGTLNKKKSESALPRPLAGRLMAKLDKTDINSG
jgi:hypothetical protein